MNGLKVIQSDLLASGSNDHKVKLWNLTTYTFIADLTWHTDCVNAIETFYGTFRKLFILNLVSFLMFDFLSV